ncbi:MAG: hypothetical protein JST23_11070 [Bacteroidetes bacterium]|nr:hypothetical protein [Bacteroidota bacterium]
MQITINNSTVTIYQEEKVGHPVDISRILRTSYETLQDRIKNGKLNDDKIRDTVLSEIQAAIAKSKPQV